MMSVECHDELARQGRHLPPGVNRLVLDLRIWGSDHQWLVFGGTLVLACDMRTSTRLPHCLVFAGHV